MLFRSVFNQIERGLGQPSEIMRWVKKWEAGGGKRRVESHEVLAFLRRIVEKEGILGSA